MAGRQALEQSEPGAQLPAWDETMTDKQILNLLPRVAAVGAQTEASLQIRRGSAIPSLAQP
jgi:hypothetical protein